MIAGAQNPNPAAPIRVAVLLATKGRPQAAAQLMRLLEEQTLAPSIVVVSATSLSDVESEAATPLNVEYIFGAAGLTAQRNRALERVRACAEVAIFFDDDFAPAGNWIEQCAKLFTSESNIVGASGTLVRDGATALPISWEEAHDAIAAQRPMTPLLTEIGSLYGCNMAFRLSAIEDMQFDERLVLYGWLEDKEFSRKVAKKGRLVRYNLLVGVHLGLQSGRVSGKRYGYSQIVNAWYLYKKGTLSKREVSFHFLKAFLANAAKAFRPEGHIDRRGRLKGNLIGVFHLLSRPCRPEAAAEL
jgi:glycosyltransferase involved in cell wall biosynthesis